jgi:hypothetical protein
MATRFPVIGSRMVMGSSFPFRQTENAVPAVSIRVACDCGYGTVTALDAHISKADEARMDRLACSVEEADPIRSIGSAGAWSLQWLTAH